METSSMKLRRSYSDVIRLASTLKTTLTNMIQKSAPYCLGYQVAIHYRTFGESFSKSFVGGSGPKRLVMK
jgi:hypothetical protein